MYADDGDKVEIKEEYQAEDAYQDLCLTKFDLDYKLKRSEHQHEFFFAPNENCKSDVWDRFFLIYYRGIKQDYVKCRKCFSILSYKSRTGTASLLRHNCERKNALKIYEQEPPTLMIPTIVNKAIPDEARNEIHQGQLYFLAKDMHAFDTTDRVGFKKLAQLLINFGSDFGNQPVNEVLAPTDHLVNSLMTFTITNISRIIRNFILDEHLALTVDISNETCSQKRFLTLSGHVITNEYAFKSFIINTLEISEPPHEIDLKRCIVTLLDDYVSNSDVKLSNSTIVLDNRHNQADSLSDYKVLSSAGHIVQAILDELLLNLPDDFRKCLNTMKDFIENLETISNRTVDIYYTLKYFHDHLKKTLQDNQDQRLSNLDSSLLQTFYELLDLFKECLADLKTEDTTTMGKVYLWKIKLKNFCNSIKNDNQSSVEYYLKTNTLSMLNKHLVLNDYHKIALFLNPNFKGLKFLKIPDKQEIYDLIKIMSNKMKDEEDLIFLPSNHSTNKPPPPKRFKDEINFGEMMDATEGDSDDESTESEIFRYVNYKLKDHCSDVLEYWKLNNDFPNLKKLVRRILNVPASVVSKQNLICQGPSNSGTTKSCSCAFKDNIKSLVFLNKNFNLTNYNSV